MTDIAELVTEARLLGRRKYVLWPVTADVVFRLADALEALDRENQALARALEARIS